jgi:hypothetical protein
MRTSLNTQQQKWKGTKKSYQPPNIFIRATFARTPKAVVPS